MQWFHWIEIGMIGVMFAVVIGLTVMETGRK